MSFKQNFCPSPWLHMRITNTGTYEPCRWMVKSALSEASIEYNIKNTTPSMYFQSHMSPLRNQLLHGQSPAMCNDCTVMEKHHKPSGRQRQLLKIGVRSEYFEKSLAGSPLRSALDHSSLTAGHTDRTVSDWQIDLGNYCNGACVFCSPKNSSTLALEFKQLGLIDHMPPRSWCDDPVLFDKFTAELVASPALRYLHFLGGETVITPGFKKILSALIDAGIASNVTIGFTTNLTVWNSAIVDLLCQFQQVHLGLSVETLTAVNDYVRYPSKQIDTRHILDQWVNLAKKQDWLTQVRITPTCLTVHEITTVYDYAWQHELSVESCNFLSSPACFKISVLPPVQREHATHQLQSWIDSHPVLENEAVINTRDPNLAKSQIVQDASSYLHYLESAEDESYQMPNLVAYLKRLESSRGNSILTYLPQYEDLFRSAGY